MPSNAARHQQKENIMQANQTSTQSMLTRINTRKTRRFTSSKVPASKAAATTQQRKAAKAHTLALLFKIIFG